jgi:hypothetical protein
MIIDNKPQHLVEMSHQMETTTFSIEQSAKAFVVLSSSLYKDKVRSIIRELSCNARDAHVDVGNESIPFDVHLPTSMEPEFWIRDYGTGLSDKDIKTVYTRYFKSTKETNNDAVGCLGLGSKSPFAYTQSFMVTSWFNGTKTIYSVFINDNSEPSIAKMFAMATDEPNGIEVRFNVPGIDQSKFEVAAKQVYCWFDTVKPKFIGRSVVLPEQTKLASLVLTKSQSSTYNGSTLASIVMGGVEYPIDINNPEVKKVPSISSFLACIRISGQVNVTVAALVKMGAVDFTPSREELQYTKKTLNAISSAFLSARQEFIDILPELKESDFDELTFSEAVQKAQEFITLRAKTASETGVDQRMFQQNSEIDAILEKKFSFRDLMKSYIFQNETKNFYTFDFANLPKGQNNIVPNGKTSIFVIQDVTGIGAKDILTVYPNAKPVLVFESLKQLAPGGRTIKDAKTAKEIIERLGFKCILASEILTVKLKDRKYHSIYQANVKIDKSNASISFGAAKKKEHLVDYTVPVFYVELSNKKPKLDKMYFDEMGQLVYFAGQTGFKFQIVGVYMPTTVDLSNALNFEEHFAKKLDFWMQSSTNRNIFIVDKIKSINQQYNNVKHSQFREVIESVEKQVTSDVIGDEPAIAIVTKLSNEIHLLNKNTSGISNSEFSVSARLMVAAAKYFPMTKEKAESLCNIDTKRIDRFVEVDKMLNRLDSYATCIKHRDTKEFFNVVKSVYNLVSLSY